MLPRCCGNPMTITVETNKFIEVQCPTCRDTVYVKKEDAYTPQLLDD